MINVDVSAKLIKYVKKISFGILLHVVVKMVEYLASILMMIQWLGVMKLLKNEKLFQQILMKKSNL